MVVLAGGITVDGRSCSGRRSRPREAKGRAWLGSWGCRGLIGASRGSQGGLWRRRRRAGRQQKSGEVEARVVVHGFGQVVARYVPGTEGSQRRALEHQEGHGS